MYISNKVSKQKKLNQSVSQSVSQRMALMLCTVTAYSIYVSPVSPVMSYIVRTYLTSWAETADSLASTQQMQDHSSLQGLEMNFFLVWHLDADAMRG